MVVVSSGFVISVAAIFIQSATVARIESIKAAPEVNWGMSMLSLKSLHFCDGNCCHRGYGQGNDGNE